MNKIQITYRRFPGYGDIISPICYSHNIARYFKIPTNLTFYYTPESNIYEHPDSESVEYRTSFIFDNTDKTDIEEINHQHIAVSHIPGKHNMLESLKHHNVAFAKKELQWTGGEDYVVFIRTTNNFVQFKDYPDRNRKLWKDPLSTDEWDLLETFHHNSKYIDYTTPIVEAVEILKNCKMVIAYHGSAAWLARWLGCPIIIFSGRPSLTAFSFPFSVIREHFDNQLLSNEYLTHCQKVSADRLNSCNEEIQTTLIDRGIL